MLNLLLDLLRAGGTRRVADLAAALDTTPELVEAMLEELGRLGYLKRMGGACGGACGGCSMSSLCATGGSGQVWMLTDKADQQN